eukprot:COSAG02_NODE_71122_length_192_cov_44.387097_1_plen_59_part_10
MKKTGARPPVIFNHYLSPSAQQHKTVLGGEPETLGGLAKQNARDNLGNILRHRPIFNWG